MAPIYRNPPGNVPTHTQNNMSVPALEHGGISRDSLLDPSEAYLP